MRLRVIALGRAKTEVSELSFYSRNSMKERQRARVKTIAQIWF
jgi:hypothetical protein